MMDLIRLHIIRFGIEIFFQDDEEEDQTPFLQKVWGFAEETVPNFTDRQFQSHFRLTPTTFEDLLGKFHSVVAEGRKVAGNPETTEEKQLMISLWYLANLESFRGVADRFGVSKSTAWDCLHKTCKKLLQVNTTYNIIAFPNYAKCNEIINSFRNKTGFPGIVGAIDGSHIPIVAPKAHPASYVNRKGYHSVLLQAICDDKKKFLDCYAGEVGSVHDACLFRRSEIGRRLPTLELPQDGHLIGDSAYPLSTKLMVPYKDNGHLTNVQRNYNVKHAKSRVIIEQAFALLKGRFRRLKLLETVRLDLIPVIIISTCIFHNICLLSNDIPGDVNVDAEMQEEMLMNPENIYNEGGNHVEGSVKRNNIANGLFIV